MKYTYKTLFIFSLLTTTMFANMSQSNTLCFEDNSVQDKKVVKSNIITISGQDKAVPVEINGPGEYLLNGREMKREKVYVHNGDKIQLKHMSLKEDGAKVSTTLVVGDTYDIFTTVTNRGTKDQNSYKIEQTACKK